MSPLLSQSHKANQYLILLSQVNFRNQETKQEKEEFYIIVNFFAQQSFWLSVMVVEERGRKGLRGIRRTCVRVSSSFHDAWITL